LKGARELKEKRKKQQEENVKRKEDAKEAMRRKSRGEDPEKPDDKKKKKDGDDSDAGSDVEGAEADDTANPEEKKRLFANYQKKRIVPNISSVNVRAPGISKGMWKKELKEQMGINTKRSRSGVREGS
tara:strand:- start:263 stop:646 length:384 start_codon:yes stop_codon:yes gene_type:complete